MPLIFQAGLDKNEFRRFQSFAAPLVQNFMYTYFDFLGPKGEDYFLKSLDQISLWRPDARLFLDSGAYSAFTLGKPFSLTDYMTFLEKYEDQFYMYASLDDKASQEKTYANYKEMRANGFTPAPVWHAIGGPMDILEEYMADETVPYVCIGAIAKERISDDFSYKRLNAVFKLVGKYKKPIHAFGRTEPELLVRYPFTSADSSTWYCVRHGAILDWNPISRSLRQIRMRNSKAMERAFGPRAKVLMGNVPNSYDVPHYYIATEHNLGQLKDMEQALEAYWQRRGVMWNYAAIDRSWKHGNLTPATRQRCQQRRSAVGTPVMGDTGYTLGQYVGTNVKTRFRETRKWENKNRDETFVPFQASIKV